jgi:hypothetical protein
MPPYKKLKTGEVLGSQIKYDERANGYKANGKYVSFGIGDKRVYEVGDFFLNNTTVFSVLSDTHSSIVLGDPVHIGGLSDKKTHLLKLRWIISKSDPHFSKNCPDELMEKIHKSLEDHCDRACLQGLDYLNKFGDKCKINFNGDNIKEICILMKQEARELYINAADLMYKSYKGHISNGDSSISVSSIRAGDMPAYKILFREKILKAQRVDKKEFLITNIIDDAEDIIVKQVTSIKDQFESQDIPVINNSSDGENLIEEQLQACNVAMNNGISYICGMPGVGKTSCLCKIIEMSKGTVILTPSHVSREVVMDRGYKNGLDPKSYSVEVLAFAVRHIEEWVNSDIDQSGEKSPPAKRSIDMMQKFLVGKDNLQIETLIIEEASMADLIQTAKVINDFSKIPSLKRVVFCGDHRQLPSVSKGRVLQDIMECEHIPGTVLSVNHRSKSALSSNLKHILVSNMSIMNEDETFEVKAFDISQCNSETDRYGRTRVVAYDPVVSIYMEHFNHDIPCHIFAYTNIEVKQLNIGVKLALFGEDSVRFPNGCRVRVLDSDSIVPAIFHHNDFLVIVENRGTKEYVVKRWNDSNEFPDVTLITVTGKIKDVFDLGYASSIHAFQGSECSHIICHAVPNAVYFNRDGLYTAVSRAKAKATIVTVSDKNHNWKKVLYRKSIDRISNLTHRINKEIEKRS